MAEYAMVREIQNLCPNNQMRDIFFDEVETEDPESYVRVFLKGKAADVTVENGQAIIATDGSSVNATNQVGTDGSELAKLIAAVQAATDSLAPEDKEAVQESLEVIEAEASAEKPKKSMLRTALSTLSAIKGIAEFGAAVAALAQFVGQYL